MDEDRRVQDILTGSSNFLLLEKTSRTLAGRTAVLHLLPFSFAELVPGAEPYEDLIFKSRYPRIYDRDIAPTDFYPAYIQTCVERDVRLLKNIGDINAFIQFIRLCIALEGLWWEDVENQATWRSQETHRVPDAEKRTLAYPGFNA